MDLPLPVKIFEIELKRGTDNKLLEIDNIYDINKQVYFSITNLGEKEISPQLIVNEKDWFTNAGILDNALQKELLETDEDIVVALWQFVTRNHYHHTSSPLNERDYELVENPVQYFNSWGYGLCDDVASVMAQLTLLAGYKSRAVYLNGHVVTEVYYGGGWHMFDADFGLYGEDNKGNIVSVEEIYRDKKLIKQAIRRLNRPGGLYDMQVEAYSSDEDDFIANADSFYPENLPDTFSYSLRANEEIRFYNNWQHKYYRGSKDMAVPPYSNGLLITPITKKYLEGHPEEGESTIRITLPYPIVGAYATGIELCESSSKVILLY